MERLADMEILEVMALLVVVMALLVAVLALDLVGTLLPPTVEASGLD